MKNMLTNLKHFQLSQVKSQIGRKALFKYNSKLGKKKMLK